MPNEIKPKIVHSTSTNPFVNLAIEEFLLAKAGPEGLKLWPLPQARMAHETEAAAPSQNNPQTKENGHV